jgi:hypothetical protein
MDAKSGQPKKDEADPSLQVALKVIIVLLTVIVALAALIVFNWRNSHRIGMGSGLFPIASPKENVIQMKFPSVDFSLIYPGLPKQDIDQLQRDCIGLRYIYAPFVEFAPLPVTGRFVNITSTGFRKGRTDAPWPPLRDELVVFVFGGSTTLGFGLPDAQTVVSALEKDLGRKFPSRNVRCYNFGRGYYFSAQERLLFESLLSSGYIPNVAVFIDGLNDFIYYDGVPQLAPALFSFTAPDFPMPQRQEPVSDAERKAAVEQLVFRYRQNAHLTEAAARAYRVSTIFVGQPVPFLDFPMTPSTYPFGSTYKEHQLCGWGYGYFRQAAQEGVLGERFVWCGDAFAKANHIMYVDSIHYSAAGAETLAADIVEKAVQGNLLPAR